MSIKNECGFGSLGIMADCSRNAVLKPDSVKKLIRLMAAMGYNTLQLYTEDTYEVNNEPYFGYFRGRYTKQEIKEIDAYAKQHGVELIPCIQTLAHLNAIMKWYGYAIRDIDDILLVGEERTYELIEHMFSTLAECFSSRKVNIGMDEAHMLGLGRYLEKHGFKDRFEIMTSHLDRVAAIADKYGFRCMMWSDMFFRLASGGDYYNDGGNISEEIIRKIPKNVSLIYWDYYSTDESKYNDMIIAHKRLKDEIIFAGGAWSWLGFTPHNALSMDRTEKALSACKKNGVKDVFITVWGDNGGECSVFKLLPALAFAAGIAQGKSAAQIKSGFKKLVGIFFDDFMLLDNADRLQEAECDEANPSKYLLYNDCFMGINDCTLAGGEAEYYREAAEALKKCERNKDFGHLFKSQRLLCETLALKCDLGVLTRALYEKKDKKGIAELVTTKYRPLIKKLKEFYNVFLAYWETDYKPHGFDIQDIRLGGLITRVTHCAAKLSAFAAGKIDGIEELDEKTL
ncbi:MAG: beta-N-acetylhexosaminidase, partial [Firmicutes bacterium]|nr:beta-N-acetylhexosaminidase [Bacillota bacterium]